MHIGSPVIPKHAAIRVVKDSDVVIVASRACTHCLPHRHDRGANDGVLLEDDLRPLVHYMGSAAVPNSIAGDVAVRRRVAITRPNLGHAAEAPARRSQRPTVRQALHLLVNVLA